MIGYGETQPVSFQRVVGLDAAGNPILAVDAAGNPIFETQLLEGDLVLSGNIWGDAKHGAIGNQDLHIWNQIQKGQAALNQGLISGYRFESSSSMGAAMRTGRRPTHLASNS